jgi:hypothetical protein
MLLRHFGTGCLRDPHQGDSKLQLCGAVTQPEPRSQVQQRWCLAIPSTLGPFEESGQVIQSAQEARLQLHRYPRGPTDTSSQVCKRFLLSTAIVHTMALCLPVLPCLSWGERAQCSLLCDSASRSKDCSHTCPAIYQQVPCLLRCGVCGHSQRCSAGCESRSCPPALPGASAFASARAALGWALSMSGQLGQDSGNTQDH